MTGYIAKNLHKSNIALAAIGVLVASIGFGLVPFFSRSLTDQGIVPHAVAFYRYIFAAVVLFPVLLWQRGELREIIWGIIAGAVLGLGWIGYVTALQTVPASTVGVLYMTYPIFTVGLAWLFFQDPPTKRALSASLVILIAAILVGAPATISLELLPAVFLSLTAPIGFGFGICVLVHRLSRLSVIGKMASISLGSVLGLAPLMLFTELDQYAPKTQSAWTLIAGIAILTALIPQLIYTYCAPKVGASRSAIMGSVELPTMFAIGVFAFGETLSYSQAIAGGLIIFAIAINSGIIKRQSNVPTK